MLNSTLAQSRLLFRANWLVRIGTLTPSVAAPSTPVGRQAFFQNPLLTSPPNGAFRGASVISADLPVHHGAVQLSYRGGVEPPAHRMLLAHESFLVP
jgi:hypothetical protein